MPRRALARRPPPLLLDAAALAGATALVALSGGFPTSGAARAALLALPALTLGLLWLRGAYDGRALRGHSGLLDELQQLVGLVSLATMAALAAIALVAPGASAGGALARGWLLMLGLLVLGRVIRRRLRWPGRPAPTLIVGAGQVGARVERRLRELPELGLDPVGFLDANPLSDEDVPGRSGEVLGSTAQLSAAIAATGAQHVILAFLSTADRSLVRLVEECRRLGVEVWVVPRLFDSTSARVSVDYVGGLPLLRMREAPRHAVQLALKHGFDRVAAGLCLLLLAPPLLAIVLAVRLSSPGPILFRQRRIGRDGRAFEMLKFRSMELTDQPPGRPAALLELLPGDLAGPGGVEGADRRTRVGSFLRRSSLDELPQLLNIVRGEMSFVGPRPERQEYVELFADSVERYLDRQRMRAGLTGWAQVNGLRGQTPMARRVEWDNWYIDNWSLALDLKILLLTALAMRRGAR